MVLWAGAKVGGALGTCLGTGTGGRAAGGKGKVQRHFGWLVGAYLVESSSAAPLAPHVK